MSMLSDVLLSFCFKMRICEIEIFSRFLHFCATPRNWISNAKIVCLTHSKLHQQSRKSKQFQKAKNYCFVLKNAFKILQNYAWKFCGTEFFHSRKFNLFVQKCIWERMHSRLENSVWFHSMVNQNTQFEHHKMAKSDQKWLKISLQKNFCLLWKLQNAQEEFVSVD